MRRKPLTKEEFYARTQRHETSGCMVWQAAKNPSGYGRQKWRNVTMLAHRLSWVLTYGSIQREWKVEHKCSTRLCVNPHHLKLVCNGRVLAA